MCQRRGRDLKRALIDHNGMSPIGLLRWCLQFANESTAAPSPALTSVRQRFGGVEKQIRDSVNRINGFRNDYIAHQGKALTDAALVRNSLKEWSDGVVRLWQMHRHGLQEIAAA